MKTKHDEWDDNEPEYVGVSPTHSFFAGRCIHCDCDNHSLPERGETLTAYEKPCPVGYDSPERTSSWSFPEDLEEFLEAEPFLDIESDVI